MLYGKPERRKKRPPDRVEPSDAEFVLRRDGECIIAKLARRGWLTPHKPCAGRLTIEHTLRVAGRRAHGRSVTVAACMEHNVNGECSRQRDHVRRYLAELPSDIVE